MNNPNDNIRTDGTRSDLPDVSTTRMAAPKTSKLAILLSFAAGATAAWILMTITQQDNEAVESQQPAPTSINQTRKTTAPASQTGKNKTGVPRPVTQ